MTAASEKGLGSLFPALAPDAVEAGDLVLCNDRLGWIYGFPDAARSYVYVIFFDSEDGQPIGEPWSALQSAGSNLWRCRCGRFWKIATAPSLCCDKCGQKRG